MSTAARSGAPHPQPRPMAAPPARRPRTRPRLGERGDRTARHRRPCVARPIYFLSMFRGNKRGGGGRGRRGAGGGAEGDGCPCPWGWWRRDQASGLPGSPCQWDCSPPPRALARGGSVQTQPPPPSQYRQPTQSTTPAYQNGDRHGCRNGDRHDCRHGDRYGNRHGDRRGDQHRDLHGGRAAAAPTEPPSSSHTPRPCALPPQSAAPDPPPRPPLPADTAPPNGGCHARSPTAGAQARPSARIGPIRRGRAAPRRPLEAGIPPRWRRGAYPAGRATAPWMGRPRC